MELSGRHIVITGAASGIGAAMARRFAAEHPGPRGIVVADLDEGGASQVAADVGGIAVGADVSEEGAVLALIADATGAYGPIDLFCSNAGIGVVGGPEAGDADWERIWKVNVMAHVWAARALVPVMVERGHGYLLNTASAAGLLTNLGALPYTVTKHAAVALAEWLSITYGSAGLKVSCLCPQGVRTPMLLEGLRLRAGSAVLASGDVMEPAEVAEAVVEGIRLERFLILPHAEVAGYMRRKADDPERWLAGMRRQQASLDEIGSGT
jgi:NAD(P)-dependent dehydrogenase (short-subunit alcohol dehydrogenase family)